MFSLFRSRRDESAVVAPDGAAFMRRFPAMLTPRGVFDAQGEAHGRIDMDLTSAVEGLLRPVLGPWEQSSTWFHQMDYHGDGVRMLMFRRDVFPREQLPALQALLAGPHEPFVILCIVRDDLSAAEGDDADYLALSSRRTLATRRLANALSLGAAG